MAETDALTRAGHYRHRAAVFRLSVAGKDISTTVRPLLISLSLTEKRGSDADELDLVLDDSNGQLQIPPKGAVIMLALGWRELGSDAEPVLIDKGRFIVDETCHSGAPDRLTIRAKSADLTRGFRARREQSWSNTTLGAVLTEVAGRNGLQPSVAGALSSVALAHLAQGRESDAALITRLGRDHDAVATVKAGRLLFSPIGAGVTPGGLEIPPATITRRSGDGHSWKTAERGSYSGVTAEWQDRQGGRRQEVVAGTKDNARRLGRIYASAKSAKSAVDAEFARLNRGKAEFSINLAIGRPDLYPERKLTVAGFKAEIDSTAWLITEVRHSLDNNGLRSSLQLELATA